VKKRDLRVLSVLRIRRRSAGAEKDSALAAAQGAGGEY
jgi:hypothetical protein